MKNETEFYNDRFQLGYREHVSGIEFARRAALEHVIRRVLKLRSPRTVLDYGAGNGLFVDFWQSLFPNADFFFCDISDVALTQLAKKYPNHKDNCRLIKDDRTPFAAHSFDIVVSIEVMEHVGNLSRYLDEIGRVLKPNGYFIWTTPCANALSIEYAYSRLRNQIENTAEGFVRWKWEDPAHVRRLTSNQIRALLLKAGYDRIGFRFRSHFFSFICSRLCEKKRLGKILAERLMLLDYKLFRRFPNGASMIGFAQKRNSGAEFRQ